ncbi:hypothetical protein KAR28_06205 [Candidatus Parcubacteria bacterium]|nr:hypothetical protein [Candidatus Parcubacteria bacterium]
MTIEDLQSIIRNNVDDAEADVDKAIDLGINFLSNFFVCRKMKDDGTVTTGDTSIAKPDHCLKILHLKIGDDYIKKAELNKLQQIEDNDSMRWHVEDDFNSGAENKIQLTKAVSSGDNGDTVYIWYLAGFTPLAGAALSETDLPERLEPLLISFVTYFYYGILVSYVKNNKSEFENMTLWDVIAIWDTWRIHSFDLLEIVKKQHFNLED